MPTVDCTTAQLALWAMLPSPDGEFTPLFQVTDGVTGVLVGVCNRQLAVLISEQSMSASDLPPEVRKALGLED